MKDQIFSIKANSKYGVLNRVVGVFNRRGSEIDSISLGRTDTEGTYTITIVSRGDTEALDLIRRQLERLIDVVSVEEMDPNRNELLELTLVKIRKLSDSGTRLDIVASTFGADIFKDDSVFSVLRLTANPLWTDTFLERITEFDVVAVSRSGGIAV